MVYCAVFNCNSNNNKNCKGFYPEGRYFSFPLDKVLCKEWVHKCRQQKKLNTKNARICSKHFVESDYCLQDRMLNMPKNKWKLNRNAVPSQNLPTVDENITNKCRETGKRRRLMDINDIIIDQEEFEETNNSDGTLSPSEHPVLKDSGVVNIGTQTDSSENDLLQQIEMLKQECTSLKRLAIKQKQDLDAVQKIFTKGQLCKLRSGIEVKWTMGDIASAVTLHAAGPRAYRLLRKRGYPLPSVSTLRRWAGKLGEIEVQLSRNCSEVQCLFPE